LEHGEHANDHLHEEGALKVLANYFGNQPASSSTAVDKEENPSHSVLQISSENRHGNDALHETTVTITMV
jgi:hypothetical protein